MKQRTLRMLIYVLIGSLIVEGLVRKIAPGPLPTLLIFFKDGICLLILGGTAGAVLTGAASMMRAFWFMLGMALVPIVLLTAIKDPTLAVFGTKQYVLFFPVAWALPYAFTAKSTEPEGVWRLGRFLGAFIIPTSILALVQISLPDSHWLNLSIAGEDLSGFSAGGKLRVSSSFPFIAQYNFFLTFVAGWIVTAMRWPGKGKVRWLLKSWLILPAYVVGLFITGSRQSVVGTLIIVFVGALVVGIQGRGVAVRRFISVGIAGFIAFVVAQFLFPDAFVAYEARSGGDTFSDSNSTELLQRLDHATFGWVRMANRTEAGMFGLGLGIMSNGVQQLSPYAASIRDRYGWAEVDMGNTVVEGGFYLVVIWAAFRIAVIVSLLPVVGSLRNATFAVAGALLYGYVVFNGLVGTLGIQPPLYIWWSLAVGSILLLRDAEVQARQATKRKEEN